MSIKNYNKFIETKSLDAFSIKTLEDIKLMSLNKDKLAKPFGSVIYEIQKYPGDLDLIETYTECCNVNDVLLKVINSILLLLKDINKKKSTYFFELKAGSDLRYDIDIGKLSEGQYLINKDNIAINIKKLFENDLLNMNEVTIIMDLVNKKDVNTNDYDIINQLLKEHKILFWNEKEIIEGIKYLPGNISISLLDALKMEGKIRIGVISYLDGRFIEITNFLLLIARNKNGKEVKINFKVDISDYENFSNLYVSEMQKDIELFLFSEMNFKPFKALKRIFALARHFKDKEMILSITPFISGSISALYQIVTDINTIILLLVKIKSQSNIKINDELSIIKSRLSSILTIDNKNIYYQLIDKAILSSKKEKIKILEQIKNILLNIVNDKTIKFIKDGLIPIPRIYLPNELRYISYFQINSKIKEDKIVYKNNKIQDDKDLDNEIIELFDI